MSSMNTTPLINLDEYSGNSDSPSSYPVRGEMDEALFNELGFLAHEQTQTIFDPGNSSSLETWLPTGEFDTTSYHVDNSGSSASRSQSGLISGPYATGYTTAYDTSPTEYSHWSSPGDACADYDQSARVDPTSSGMLPPSVRDDKGTRKRKSSRHSHGKSSHQPTERGTQPAETNSYARRGSRQGKHSPDNDEKTQRKASISSIQDIEERSARIQQRNRIASNKFRVKKREDAVRLKSDQEDMERINRNLSSCVADLNQEVYSLKMQLFQHTDCNCSMIQNYIANEAQRYIRRIEGDNVAECPHHHPRET